jgi:hypothetical protein
VKRHELDTRSPREWQGFEELADEIRGSVRRRAEEDRIITI